jgi:hypothetical protein
MKFSISYYTLSDGKNTVEIEANNADEAASIARERDDTFDRVFSIAVIAPIQTGEPVDCWPL